MMAASVLLSSLVPALASTNVLNGSDPLVQWAGRAEPQPSTGGMAFDWCDRRGLADALAS